MAREKSNLGVQHRFERLLRVFQMSKQTNGDATTDTIFDCARRTSWILHKSKPRHTTPPPHSMSSSREWRREHSREEWPRAEKILLQTTPVNDLPSDDKRIVGSIRHERPHRVLAMISDSHASFLLAASARPEYWCTYPNTKGFVKRTRWRNERTIRNLQYAGNRFDCRFRWSSIITRLDSVILRLCPYESSIYERCPSDSSWKPRNEAGLFLSVWDHSCRSHHAGQEVERS